jgi:formyltetrahydrofolate-dependent phosphoribosylglycinamide formyltransferase
MFQRLQQKWKVNGLQLLLILCTFAIGGSLTGYTGKKMMNLLSIQQSGLWIVVYIIVITLIWPLAVLLISIPFGQYQFFINYLKKMGRRLSGRRKRSGNGQQATGNKQALPENDLQIINKPFTTHHSPLTTRLAIFASGAGSNAQKIIDHFRNSSLVNISLIVCNRPSAGVLNIAAKENIPVLLIEKEKFFRGNAYTDELKEYKIDYVILAGFLWKIPASLIKAFPGKVVNIHPALLPKYGGKGMYGHHVHEAVIAAKEKQSGITIHYVDEHYDHGDTIFQAYCDVFENDSPDALSQRIHKLEHEHYPVVIENLISKKR